MPLEKQNHDIHVAHKKGEFVMRYEGAGISTNTVFSHLLSRIFQPCVVFCSAFLTMLLFLE